MSSVILFQQDWARYPSAIVDINTTNKSWVRLAALYKGMGVRNHAFLLALVNPLLQGVDPHSKYLTPEQEAMIGVECKVNPWYYFREIAKAPAMGGSGSVPMEANRGNISLYWLFFNHIMTFLIQIRQTGKSFSTDSLMTYLMHIGCDDTQINLLTKDDSLRRANVQRLKDIADELPSYLNQKTKEDAANTEEITIRRKKNVYKTHVPQPSPKRALNMGRGLTSGIFHIDEPPFQPNIAIALPAALAATGKAVDRAREADAHFGTILTTTAGRKDDKDGLFIYNMLQESAVWTEKFFDARDEEHLYEMVRKASPKGKLRVNITLNHRQLGKTDQWLMQKLEESVQSGDDANRDYFNMWTSGNMSSPLSIKLLEQIRNSVRGADHTEISTIGSYTMRWYIPQDQIADRMASGRFVLGSDTSNAQGADDITLYLLDIETLETIACANVNETNLIHFSRWLASFMVKYKNVTLNIENRSTGQMIIDYLLIELMANGENPFKRIYNTVVNEKTENPALFEEMTRCMQRGSHEILDRLKATFGFKTAGMGSNARSILYGTVLQLAAKRAGDRINDKTLADQITGLIIRNGRVDHPIGGHDDLCIGWLLSHWLVTQAKNLKYYGIDPVKVGSLLGGGDDFGADPAELAFRKEQRELRARVSDLTERISSARDSFLTARLEQEIRAISYRVVVEENEIFNVDDMIRLAKEKKKADRFSGNNSFSAAYARPANSSWNGAGYNSYGGYGSRY